VKPRWTSETGVEVANLRALVPLLASAAPEVAQELALTIGRYLDASHAFRAGAEEVARFVAELPHPSPVLVSLLSCLGDLHLRTGDVAAAERVLAEAERLALEVDGPPLWDDVAVERTRGEIDARKGNHGAAVTGAYRALARGVSLRGQARMCSQLGVAALAQGDLETAWEACERELAAYVELEDESFQASAHGNLAEIALRRGDDAAAAAHQRACLALALELGAPAMVAFSLIVAARLTAATERWATATVLHAQAETILDAIGLALYDDDRKLSDSMLEAARTHLGFVAFSDAVARGRALPVPDAARLADEVLAVAGQARR
jgi:ATP/maltotriose-dependent transcriptional regulator MalT